MDTAQNSQNPPPVQPADPVTDGTLNMQVPVAKESLEGTPLISEKVTFSEIKEPEPPKEVQGWVQKMEKGQSITLPTPITDDYGQILMQSSGVVKPKIILPMDFDEVEAGLKQKVVASVRWLAMWCLRLLKMAPDRTQYNQVKQAKS